VPETNLDRALGRVEGKLDGVLTSIASLNAAITEDRARAAQARAAMNERIEGTEHGIENIEHRIAAIERGVEEIKPLADEVRQWKQRGIGAAGVITALGAIFGGALVAFRDKIMASLGMGG
jgi:prefoldin subunit 5